MENNVAPRRYYADPTADAAIGNIMREERAEKRKAAQRIEAELQKREAEVRGGKGGNVDAAFD